MLIMALIAKARSVSLALVENGEERRKIKRERERDDKWSVGSERGKREKKNQMNVYRVKGALMKQNRRSE